MLEKLVGLCLRWPWLVVLSTLALTGGGAYFTATRFAIDTDTDNLFSPTIPWRENEAALYKAFPQLDELIVAVIDGATPEKAEDAAKRLNAALQGAPMISRSWRPDDNEFFRSNGLLFLTTPEVKRIAGTLIAERDVLQAVAEDPSLRGLAGVVLSNQRQIGGSQRGQAMFNGGLDEMSNAFELVLAGEPARVSWEKLLAGGAAQPVDPSSTATPDLRRIVLIKPIIDYSALQPGAEPIELVRKTAADLQLTKDQGITLRLTGQAPLADEEFGTISENMGVNLSVTLGIVALILFVALRSPKLILAVLANLIAGLALTAGLGIVLIGRFNLISVAFAALFIGLGVDFGIQFATRYREERYKTLGLGNHLDDALLAATRGIGGSLTLAAVSLLAGFFCFLPTDFRGVSELGLIAGFGMIIAYVTTLTFLPAAIKLLHPRAEKLPVETALLAHVDHWILDHRALVIIGAVGITLLGAPHLRHLSFDSNPMDLRSQKVESVATFLDLAKNPRTAPNTIEILAPSLASARDIEKKLVALPEVDHVVMLDTLIPNDQDEKLPVIENAAHQLRDVLTPKIKPAPSVAETVKSLDSAAKTLLQRGGGRDASPSVVRFAEVLDALARSDAQTLEAARVAAFTDFDRLIGELRQALAAKRVTPDTLPADLASDWVSPSGKYRIEAFPKGDSNDREVMTAFARQAQKIAPDASGPPIVVAEAGNTVVRAFELAGLYSFIAIFVILAVALRNPIHVALTLGPLLLAGVMSLEATDLLGMSLNFANIIALPLMFAVGVAFHIYYVIAWRKGIVDVLSSSLTRAIFFSALTTGTAFGSLFLSSHPGTASMGALLAISLFFTLLAAFIVVPAFLGPPPSGGPKEGDGPAS
jgi:hopanoid biosynthesis associated RND transporter like protein HpnN